MFQVAIHMHRFPVQCSKFLPVWVVANGPLPSPFRNHPPVSRDLNRSPRVGSFFPRRRNRAY